MYGQDFVVGDIHGQHDKLVNALALVGFNFIEDRLFSVGDLVDRGKGSKKVVDLLQESWFDAVKGNHEQLECQHLWREVLMV
jgi:serine/threonine protein phosphatase 1